ncbi:MAG: glycosyltransferase [Daejeonella sp.]|uniref:glycosyltransferase n=1 Tax=Daejeonella sp. TaxID=2805397 RepID=UPI003C75DA96
MTLIKFVWILIQIFIGYHLILPMFLYLLRALIGQKKGTERIATEADYAIIVTAYEQTDLLPSVVDSILKLNYQNYLIYVVADKCDVSNLNFTDPKVILLRPETTLSSNIKSHFYAIDRFQRMHERVTIIDSDNLVDPEYLNKLDLMFNQGYKAVQGVREAKNLNTHYACLDAARDMYYRLIDNKVLFEIGSSATLSGSGMAFTTELYKDCLESSNIEGAGFDKVLQFEILKRDNRIAFAEQAIVYDEKTSRPEQLVKQRARWINTWFKYFDLGLKMTGLGIKKLDWNKFIFGIMLMRPPLFILLILSFIFLSINLLIFPYMALAWLLALIIFFAMFFVSFSYFKADKIVYRSLINAPKFIFYQLAALLKSKKANQLSVATKHFSDNEPILQRNNH